MTTDPGNGYATAEVMAATPDASSLDGFAGTSPEGPFADRPETLVAAAVLGGFLLAAILSRLGR